MKFGHGLTLSISGTSPQRIGTTGAVIRSSKEVDAAF